jgi:hypothetical protein
MDDVERMLASSEPGDPRAAEPPRPLVYDEPRRLAREKPGQTFDATAPVHEAHLPLVGPAGAARRRRRPCPPTEPARVGRREPSVAIGATAMTVVVAAALDRGVVGIESRERFAALACMTERDGARFEAEAAIHQPPWSR